ncbi:MAG: cardiolipin synthase [Planctomycetia bacterium]|nr:cardiolipin synthase [Planctomycetia bacterium]
MLVYVPQRRTPSAARTWLLLIFLLPVPGVVLYALFGRAYLPLKRVQLQSRVTRLLQSGSIPTFGNKAAEHDLPTRFRETTRLAESLGDFPVVGGNDVELLADYEGSIARLIADIRAARNHVNLLYYIFADDATGRSVEAALLDAHGRGVRCLVLVDAHGSRHACRALVPRLIGAGIEVEVLLPVGLFRKHTARRDLRNHRKIAVVDGTIAYIGSQNLVDAAFKRGLVFEELVARISGPVVPQFQAVLLADRYLETGEQLSEAKRFFPPVVPAGDMVAQALPSGPGYPQANTLRLVTTLIYAAQQRVVITTPYFIPDETLLEALVAAALRGLEVRLIVSREIDQWLVGFAQRSFYEQLLEAGVVVHLHREKFLHAKHLSIDDEAVQIGSSNMDIRSFALNAEVSCIVYHRELAQKLRSIQERYIAGAETLSLERWRGRPGYVKVAENLARLVDSLL